MPAFGDDIVPRPNPTGLDEAQRNQRALEASTASGRCSVPWGMVEAEGHGREEDDGHDGDDARRRQQPLGDVDQKRHVVLHAKARGADFQRRKHSDAAAAGNNSSAPLTYAVMIAARSCGSSIARGLQAIQAPMAPVASVATRLIPRHRSPAVGEARGRNMGGRCRD